MPATCRLLSRQRVTASTLRPLAIIFTFSQFSFMDIYYIFHFLRDILAYKMALLLHFLLRRFFFWRYIDGCLMLPGGAIRRYFGLAPCGDASLALRWALARRYY